MKNITRILLVMLLIGVLSACNGRTPEHTNTEAPEITESSTSSPIPSTIISTPTDVKETDVPVTVQPTAMTLIIPDDGWGVRYDMAVFEDYNDFKYFCETKDKDITKYSDDFESRNMIVLNLEITQMIDRLYPIYSYIWGNDPVFKDQMYEIILSHSRDEEDFGELFEYETKNHVSFTILYNGKYRYEFAPTGTIVNSFDEIADYPDRCTVVQTIGEVQVAFETANGAIQKIYTVIDDYYVEWLDLYYNSSATSDLMFKDLFSHDSQTRENAIMVFIQKFKEAINRVTPADT